jgi:glycosyltransferase involved in cell wall biosynthesis
VAHRRIRIALCADALLQPNPTGTQTFLKNLVRHWTVDHSEAIDLTLFSTKGHDLKRLDTALPGGSWKKGTFDRPYWPSRIGWLWGTPNVSLSIGRRDVYLSGYHWPLGRMDRPFVAILHDLRPFERPLREVSPLNPRRLIWRLLYQKSLTECCRRASQIVCPSRFTMEHLVRLKGKELEERLTAVHHGVDAADWSRPISEEARDSLLATFGIPGDANYVLTLGQHVPNKNHARLIEAFGRSVAPLFPNAHLLVAGGFNEETARLRKQISSLRLFGRVHLLGFVKNEQLRILMKGATVFAFASLFEGFGLPVLEAFAAGVPVVCSETTSLGEIAGDAAVTVDPKDIDALGRAIAALLENSELRASCIEKGHRIAQSKTWAACADAYFGILRKVASNYQSA